jgi:hypothetical protein
MIRARGFARLPEISFIVATDRGPAAPGSVPPAT